MYPRKQGALSQCWPNVGPTYVTLANIRPALEKRPVFAGQCQHRCCFFRIKYDPNKHDKQYVSHPVYCLSKLSNLSHVSEDRVSYIDYTTANLTLEPLSAGIDFRRQNQTSIDV